MKKINNINLQMRVMGLGVYKKNIYEIINKEDSHMEDIYNKFQETRILTFRVYSEISDSIARTINRKIDATL